MSSFLNRLKALPVDRKFLNRRETYKPKEIIVRTLLIEVTPNVSRMLIGDSGPSHFCCFLIYGLETFSAFCHASNKYAVSFRLFSVKFN